MRVSLPRYSKSAWPKSTCMVPAGHSRSTKGPFAAASLAWALSSLT